MSDCERCGRPSQSNVDGFELCENCAREYRQVEQARKELRLIILPLLQAWRMRWTERGVAQVELDQIEAGLMEILN